MIFIIQLVLVVLIVGSISVYMKDSATGERVNKILLADELAGAVQLLVAQPGDAVLEFPLQEGQDLSLYVITLSGGEVSVFLEDEGSLTAITRDLLLPKEYDAVGASNQLAYFCLRKEGRSVFLESCVSEEVLEEESEMEEEVFANV